MFDFYGGFSELKVILMMAPNGIELRFLFAFPQLSRYVFLFIRLKYKISSNHSPKVGIPRKNPKSWSE